ncbi:MAG TPA: L-seryl-tRNA(Sec) selenium transferase [Acidobacteriota bacterium]|nr:L-seryl-tRNA(Sec) selenium transferase [Acidobacteriota bacterium]
MIDSTRLESLRKIPAVNQLLALPLLSSWVERTSRGFVVAQIQTVLEEIRNTIRAGGENPVTGTSSGSLEHLLDQRLRDRLRPALRVLINATGVLLHTNLGRAPLSEASQESLSAVSSQYTNLEYDLLSGGRSHRDNLVEPQLKEILGCEAATVVNNNAAAVFLILNTLAAGKEVIVSRGELVEIGGSFRIPDILERSGAILREVGTTNKTRVQDYLAAINADTALILRVHPSNYRLHGFTHRPDLKELLELARDRRLPLVEDIGSGCLLDLKPFGISDEPIAQESLAAGVDLVSFSCDKLLGGPQAGVIAGASRWIERLRKNPLMRTYRVEKLIYSSLEATLASYRTGRALKEIPVLRMMSITHAEIQARVRAFVQEAGKRLTGEIRLDLIDGCSVVGGGSCPDVSLPTTLIALVSEKRSAATLESRLRAQDPPVIVRVEQDRALIDLRTVFPFQEAALLDAICSVL